MSLDIVPESGAAGPPRGRSTPREQTPDVWSAPASEPGVGAVVTVPHTWAAASVELRGLTHRRGRGAWRLTAPGGADRAVTAPDAAAPDAAVPVSLVGTGELRRWHRRVSGGIAATDQLLILVTLLGLHLLGVLPSGIGEASLSAGVLVVWGLLLAVARTRNPRRLGTGVRELGRVLTASGAVLGLTAVLGLVLPQAALRPWALAAIPAGVVLLLVGRLVWRRTLRRRRDSGEGVRRALIIGERGKVGHLADHLRRLGPDSGFLPVRLMVKEPRDELDAPPGSVAVEARASREQIIAQARDAVTRDAVDTVILTGADQLTPQALRELGWALAALDVTLVTAPSLSEVSASRLHTTSVDGVPLVQVDYPQLSGAAAALKRAFDIAFSLAALLGLLPLLVGVAVLVRRDSPGPALFSQTRVGLRHARFRMLKFRSMVTDAEARREELLGSSEGNAVMFKLRHDPRVTKVGAVIRRLSIDELPQFLNVLRGEMSVVGPRPPLVSEVENYAESDERRLLVKPGITGLWQVGGRSDLSWEESVRLDLYYVENWSLTGDIGIVLRTLRAVVRGAGAY
ncbi:sugar transferase [Nesterenkonia sp. PF2B19]|uniref:sugar transferase n=1 Tax=Nesterenkonia sp. PF2B19 TaxID=1881858 RepID=UPI000A19C4C3|nr:sugar transferase [Nesterenkonia sp. PF2B19]OSM42851.1 hypothetical protein BCY76_011990 [Nesterenkonia sp. PF2B19]